MALTKTELRLIQRRHSGGTYGEWKEAEDRTRISFGRTENEVEIKHPSDPWVSDGNGKSLCFRVYTVYEREGHETPWIRITQPTLLYLAPWEVSMEFTVRPGGRRLDVCSCNGMPGPHGHWPSRIEETTTGRWPHEFREYGDAFRGR